MGNNPVMYVDPDGEFVFTAAVLLTIAKGIAIGAGIGAGTSAVMYSASAAASGNFSMQGLGKSVLMGAVSGGISGGIGGAFAGSAFAQTVGFNILNSTSSSIAGTAIMGGDITLGSIVGGVAGGLVASGIPNFSGVKGGSLANIGAEVGHNSLKYGISGAVTGGVAAGVDGQHVGRGIVQGTLTGAIGGAALGAVNVGLFGPAYVPDQSYGDYGNYGPVYRRGTFITRALAGEGSGVALGRNLITQEFKGNPTYYGRTYDGAHANNFLRAHETAHYNQQIKLGFAGFYGRTASQYIRLGPLNTYNTFGTLEMMANRYAYMRFGNQFKLIK